MWVESFTCIHCGKEYKGKFLHTKKVCFSCKTERRVSYENHKNRLRRGLGVSPHLKEAYKKWYGEEDV